MASRSVGGEPCSGLGREGGGAPAAWEDANNVQNLLPRNK